MEAKLSIKEKAGYYNYNNKQAEISITGNGELVTEIIKHLEKIEFKNREVIIE